MYLHHEETIRRFVDCHSQDQELLAIILGGSIAHGYATERSDVDLMFVVSQENYNRRVASGSLTYWERESCTYEEGYIDGKYISMDFIRQVSEIGSEPARFAFQDAYPVFSRISGLEEALHTAAQYPVENKLENLKRFHAQFDGWNWYTGEAMKRDQAYLLSMAVSKMALFSGRLILAHNELLYPSHKWFYKQLEQAPQKPEHLIELIDQMVRRPAQSSIEAVYQAIESFTKWPKSDSWPNQFVRDSELTWLLNGYTPIDDV